MNPAELLLLPERILRDWHLYDDVEPIGPRELRRQVAYLCAQYFNTHKEKGTPPHEVDDHLMQPAGAYEQRQMAKMLDSLAAVARPRPAGYKRKRPRARTNDRSIKTRRKTRS